MYNPNPNIATVGDANNSSRLAGSLVKRFNELFKELGLHTDESSNSPTSSHDIDPSWDPKKDPIDERIMPSKDTLHINTPRRNYIPITDQNDTTVALVEIHRPFAYDSDSCSEDSLSTISERTEPGSSLDLSKGGVDLVLKGYERTAL